MFNLNDPGQAANLAMGLSMFSKMFAPKSSRAAELANTVMGMAGQMKNALALQKLLGGGQAPATQPTTDQAQAADRAAGYQNSLYAFNEEANPALARDVSAAMNQAGPPQPLSFGGTAATQGPKLNPALLALFGGGPNFPYPRTR